MDRRRFLMASSTALGGLMLTPHLRAAGRRPLLRLAGPWASVSYPLAWMSARPGFAALAERIEFVAWRSPDELRLIALEGRADFVALPSNVAANLYNRGVTLRLQCISAWGLLYAVSRLPRETLARSASRALVRAGYSPECLRPKRFRSIAP